MKNPKWPGGGRRRLHIKAREHEHHEHPQTCLERIWEVDAGIEKLLVSRAELIKTMSSHLWQ